MTVSVLGCLRLMCALRIALGLGVEVLLERRHSNRATVKRILVPCRREQEGILSNKQGRTNS